MLLRAKFINAEKHPYIKEAYETLQEVSQDRATQQICPWKKLKLCAESVCSLNTGKPKLM